jgi:hypothetical protein
VTTTVIRNALKTVLQVRVSHYRQIVGKCDDGIRRAIDGYPGFDKFMKSESASFPKRNFRLTEIKDQKKNLTFEKWQLKLKFKFTAEVVSRCPFQANELK